MSELIQKHDTRATIRWKLLTGASALALTAYAFGTVPAIADNSDRPQIWIELGGQLSRLEDKQETFSSPLFSGRPAIFSPSGPFERPPLFSIDEEGGISFQPDNSNWIFSASIRYGRSASKRHYHQQTYPSPFVKYNAAGVRVVRSPIAAKFADTQSQNSERHEIIDFQAGKDVRLGVLGGKDTTSVISAGVRFAQFTSKSNISLKSDPDWHNKYAYLPTILFFYTTSKAIGGRIYHSNMASLRAERSFHGVGPSISWNASVPFAGNSKDGELNIDWGVDAALLFGRQKTKTQHQATQHFHSTHGLVPPLAGFTHTTPYHFAPPAQTRSRNITVPNVGGSVGLSWKLQNFKMSLGYKADFFFNAIDGGIDARKSENRAFYGPYASISIGLGD